MSVFTAGKPRRPVYRPAPGVAVPRLEEVPDGAGGGYRVIPNELYEFQRAPEAILHSGVAAWLEQPLAQRSRQLGQHDIAQLRRLTVAAVRDISGLTKGGAEEWIAVESPISNRRRRELMAGARDSHLVDRDGEKVRCREGRKLWVELAAWPWWAIVDELGPVGLRGGMPDRWWKLPRVIETFDSWARSGADDSTR
jgi:hypothetical protein